MTGNSETGARMLRDAYRHGPIPPLRAILEPGAVDEAYAIQDANTRFWQSGGRRIVGRKLGLTSKAVQMQIGVETPDFGTLFDDMHLPDGGTLDPAKVLQPKVEAEVAFVLARDLCELEPSMETITASIEYAVAALEIVDSRIVDWKVSFADTVADNGSSAFFVLGTERKSLDGLDLYSCGMVMEVNGEIASVGAGAACLGHPLKAVQWLAHTFAKRGEVLRTGDIILSGALGPMVPLVEGSRVRAQIGGLGQCTVNCGIVS